MKRIVLLFVIVLSVFFSAGELFAEDIDNNIGYNLENNVENTIGYNLENNVENTIGYNLENNVENTIGYNLENNEDNNIAYNLENNTSKEIDEIKEIKEDTNNTIEKPKPSLNDIFGDDQTFPFVAGFGKD